MLVEVDIVLVIVVVLDATVVLLTFDNVMGVKNNNLIVTDITICSKKTAITTIYPTLRLSSRRAGHKLNDITAPEITAAKVKTIQSNTLNGTNSKIVAGMNTNNE